MPPRKKPRLSSRAASSPSVDTPTVSTPAASATSAPFSKKKHTRDDEGDVIHVEPDLWTDEQEIALLKAIIRWKPVGMHKHFRMICLSQHLRSHGHREPHVSPKGIWKKLGTMYNLKTLDEREDAFAEVSSEDLDNSPKLDYEFELPQNDYGDMMFERRLPTSRSTSPAALSDGPPGRTRGSTIEDTEEARSSPASSRGGRKATRRGRGSRIARGRSRLHETTVRKGKGNAEEEESEEDDSEDEGTDEDDEDEEESRKGTPPVRGGRRGRGGRGGRGRAGRGRGGRRK